MCTLHSSSVSRTWHDLQFSSGIICTLHLVSAPRTWYLHLAHGIVCTSRRLWSLLSSHIAILLCLMRMLMSPDLEAKLSHSAGAIVSKHVCVCRLGSSLLVPH